MADDREQNIEFGPNYSLVSIISSLVFSVSLCLCGYNLFSVLWLLFSVSLWLQLFSPSRADGGFARCKLEFAQQLR